MPFFKSKSKLLKYYHHHQVGMRFSKDFIIGLLLFSMVRNCGLYKWIPILIIKLIKMKC